MSDEKVEAFRNLREQSTAMLESVDPVHVISLRADVDQLAAAAREAGYGPEQTGALVQWGIESNVTLPGSAIAEAIVPGWNAFLVLAMILEVFDDAN